MRNFLRLCLSTVLSVVGLLLATPSANAQWCYPSYTDWGYACNQPYGASFTEVTIGSVSNPSGCSGYTDYGTNIPFRLFAGMPNSVTVKAKTFGVWQYSPEIPLNIWIDFNKNFQFEFNEMFNPPGLPCDGSVNARTFTITPAANLQPGMYKARFKAVGPPEGNSQNACYSYYGEVEDYMIEILPPLSDPSPIAVSITNPGDGSNVSSPVPQGQYNVGFTLANLGTSGMTECQYTATVTRVSDNSNVVPPVTATYATPISGGGSAIIPLVANLDITNPLTPYRIQVSVNAASVKGQFANGDNNPNNNILDAFVGPALSGGEYWVGGTQTPTNWFNNPNAVAIALTYGGILGPVTFNVRPTSFSPVQGQLGQVTAQVQGIPGASPSKRVVFRVDPAQPGNAVFVAPNNGPGANNYMFKVVGNVYTTFDGITFQADGAASVARFFWLTNVSTTNFTRDFVFNNCTFNGVNTTLPGTDNYLFMTDAGHITDGLFFTGNRFNFGDVHMWLDGGFGGNGSSNTLIRNNTLTNFYSRGIIMRNLQLAQVRANTMTTQSVNPTPVTALDIELNRVGGQFIGNKISFNRTGTGIRFASNSNSSSPAELMNNMVKVGNGIANTTFALTAQNFVNTNIYFNTLLVNAPITTLGAALNVVNASATGTRVYNNIINNTNNGYAYTITSGAQPTESDFNNIRNSTCSNTSPSIGTNVGFYAGSTANNPINWYSLTLRDLNSYQLQRYSRATFLNAPNDMYIGDINRFLRGTQAINNLNGGNTNVDIDGTLRRNPPMMGAHELVPVIAYSGPNIDSTCVNTTSIVASGPVISSMKPYQYVLPMADPILAPASSISYQWSSTTSRAVQNGPKFTGVLTSTLTIFNTDEYDAGTYTCVATLNDGAKEYNGIDLTQSTYQRQIGVNQPVEIGRQPISQVVCKGSDFVLNFTTKRGTSIAYQWFKDGEALKVNTVYPFASSVEGVNNYVLTIRNADFSASGRYTCRIRTTCGATSSDTSVFTQDAIVYVAKGTQIDKEPVSQVVSAGSTAKFEVAAAEATGSFGISPVRYEWSKNGVIINNSGRYGGANSPVLTVKNVVAADAGNYSVKVIGSCGEATSQTFTLTLGTATATAVAAKVDACQSSDATLKVNASTSVPNMNLEYRWYRGDVQLFDGAKFAGAHTNNLTIKNADPADAGVYKAVATATSGVNISASANVELSLYAATQITSGLTSKKVCDGTKETLSVTATGGGNMTYQWKKDGQNIAGATSSTYEIASMDAAAAGDYTVEATGACGTVSSTATIAHSKIAGIVVNTPTVSVKSGAKIILTVNANEDGFTTYKWFFNGTEVSGATTNELVKFNASNADAGKYYCEVTNACGTSKSDEMTVAVTLSTSVDESIIAEGLKLYNNEPNPFASSTAIRFELPKPAFVTLSISDVFGREVAKLTANNFDAGIHTLNFVPAEFGLANGVYYYTLTTSGTSLTEKMLFVK
ncbi:MAG: T9SS type A sorting domain-containing protein [Ignavibacteria bacterium]|nr:T9SS type A sorting domain-containing protein [Ignavibacteria bacterium]